MREIKLTLELGVRPDGTINLDGVIKTPAVQQQTANVAREDILTSHSEEYLVTNGGYEFNAEHARTAILNNIMFMTKYFLSIWEMKRLQDKNP